MRVLVIGATGTIGGAVASALSVRHDVVRVSRSSAVSVDITDPASIDRLYDAVGFCDAVVCCAGQARRGAFGQLGVDDWVATFTNKVLAQINVVRLGLSRVRDGGSFTLTAGAYSQRPVSGVPALAMANGALESFTRAAALDLPRGIRINIVSPPLLKETAARMNIDMPFTATENAAAYVRLVEGSDTGVVVYPEMEGRVRASRLGEAAL
jgi:NAD(P)-dependent dehydrogenase (short-subunit alcohol dehydrogenase family)